ncbi:MAG: hypothetical protein LBS56_05615, partial [Propionibacteriaceae bacterium]|nr:hypothetical protein [Propionibacteriaceae bacterium]
AAGFDGRVGPVTTPPRHARQTTPIPTTPPPQRKPRVVESTNLGPAPARPDDLELPDFLT